MTLVSTVARHHGVLQRGLLYFTISVLTAYIADTSTAADRASWDLYLWLKHVASLVLPGLVAYRAFIDSHVARANGIGKPASTTPPAPPASTP